MREVLLRQGREAALTVHLGDGLRDFFRLTQEMGLPAVGVTGNCDVGCSFLAEQPTEWQIIEETGGMRIGLCHGHRFGVKYDLNALAERGWRDRLDVILFGHTHVPCVRLLSPEECPLPGRTRPLLLCNPGSIARPRSGRPTFGRLEIRGEQALFSLGEL